MNVSLLVDAQGIVPSSGSLTLQLAPSGHGVVWSADTVEVICSSAMSESTCTLYLGNAPIQANYLDETATGSTGDVSSKISGRPIRLGTVLYGVWNGADIGATCTMTVVGSQEVTA